MKDWTGNNVSVFKTLGSSQHCLEDREENDFYATDPEAAKMLMQLEEFDEFIWEPACGEGHLAKVLETKYFVFSTDLINRGYGKQKDFLKCTQRWGGSIITNPPYKYAKEFILKSLELVEDGGKIAMFLKVQFMEGKGRKSLFTNHPPKTIWVSSSRINCAKNGDFNGLRTSGGSAVAYAWFVWEKGFKGDTSIKWFN